MKRQTDLSQFFSSSGKRRSTAKASPSENISKSPVADTPKTKRMGGTESVEGSQAIAVPQFTKNIPIQDPDDPIAKEFEYNGGDTTAKETAKVSYKEDKGSMKDIDSDYEPDFSFGSKEEPKTGASKGNAEFGSTKAKTTSSKAKPSAKSEKAEKDKWELPAFIKPENIMDKNKRRPTDPDYDKTSLYIPESAFTGMTATVKQYWQIKRNNMDKVVFFKLGKFYEMFNEDAMVGHKILDLNWTGPLHVGFPERCLEKYGAILVNNGYKVIVAEQMETPKAMKKRLQGARGSHKKDEKTIKREVCQVLSKGLFVDHSNANYEAKYILSVYTDHTKIIGIAVLDIAALNVKVGQFEDDDFWQNFQQLIKIRCKFRTLCTRLRPVEVLYNKDTLKPDLKKILQNSPIIPVFSPLSRDRGEYNYIKTIPLLERYFGPDMSKWPKAISNAKTNLWQHTLSALGIAIAYLEDSLLAQQTVTTAEYEIFDLDTSILFSMTMDSQALQHLEILEVQGRTKNLTEGSLLHYLDKTMTPFGKREIKRWVCAPLYDTEDIIARQDAVADLLQNKTLLDSIRRDLQKLPDLEKKISRLYTYSVKQEKSPVFFENMNVKKLRELKEVLEALQQVDRLFQGLKKPREKLSSERLRAITGFVGQDNGIVPEFAAKLDEFKGIIDWSKLGKGLAVDHIPEPNCGVDKEYDEAKEQIKELHKELHEELAKWQEFFGDNTICYVHKKAVYIFY
eukprot:TRINITY_DN99_c0_g2_i1.p1 TRINITY_DN99_c0_g2~~TRINITY_DN99_c0_g2_i1.p1  ORF type:complete len:735 (+),score=94.06 TRINITY_DN99_c0_g2_i1:4953-7157(+)